MGAISPKGNRVIDHFSQQNEPILIHQLQETAQNHFLTDICQGTNPNQQKIHAKIKQTSSEEWEFQKQFKKKVISNRKKLGNTYPYLCVGEVHGNIFSKDVYGSGCLIGERLVLTSAQNCYSREKNMEVESMEFWLDNKNQKKIYKVIQKHYPQKFKQKKKSTEYHTFFQSDDFACLELEEKCENYGYLGVNFSQHSSYPEQKISIVGYPESHQRKIAQGRVDQTNDSLLYYEIKQQAEIGGIIIAERNRKFYVIGIHIENNPFPQKSVGLRLTPEKRERLNSWIGNLALKLENRYLGDEAMQALLQKRVEKVQTLRLSHNNLTIKGVRILATKKWINLTSFSLNGNKIGDEGIKELQHFPSVKELSLSKCGITSVGVSRLQEFSLPSLEKLVLNGNKIGNEGMTALVPFCKQLKELHLWNCGITSNGLKLLSKGCFTLLEKFVLSLNDIKDQGVEFLSKFLQLITLEFAYTSITELGVEKLVELPFERLKELWLNGDEIGEEGRIIADQYGRIKKINIKYC